LGGRVRGGLGKPVIYTCEHTKFAEGSHFDTNHHLTVLWDEGAIDVSPVSDPLARLLHVTLEAAWLQSDLHPLPSLRSWLNSWRGIGAVERGMAPQGYDLQLTRYDEKGWRATFYTTGMEHSPTSATGTAWERKPWATLSAASSI
jgi:hypothetical protein